MDDLNRIWQSSDPWPDMEWMNGAAYNLYVMPGPYMANGRYFYK